MRKNNSTSKNQNISLNGNNASAAKIQSICEIILEAKTLLKYAPEKEKEAFMQALIDMCSDDDACEFSEIRA